MTEHFFSALLNLPNAKSTGSATEVSVRCPYCEDSQKSNRPHFYIGMRDDKIWCHCKKCPASGLVTPDTLSKLGIHDISLIEYIKTTNKPNGMSLKINGGKDNHLNLSFPSIVSGRDDKKIEYISKRTQIDFSNMDNVKAYKVILNLNEFIRHNGLIPHEQPDYLFEMSESFVGFLSQNKNVISLRNVDSKKIKSRYQNYAIDPNRKAPFIYVPPCYIDPLTPSPKIVLAEGAFDIICIQKQFYPSDSTDVIFGATGTRASFKMALLHLIKLTGFSNADVSVYADVDNRSKGYEPILDEFQNKIFQPYIKNLDFQVFFNENPEQKDFGYISHTWDIKRFNLRVA